MTLDLGAVGRERVVERSWSERDAILYALSVGAGAEDSEAELELTTEDTAGVEQRVLPTFPVLLQVMPTLMLSQTDETLPREDTVGFVHGEQAVTVHRPLPPAGRATVRSVVGAIYDKGSGALVEVETQVGDAATGEPLATLVSGTFARGEGGFGGPRGETPPWERPDREPDALVSYPTRPGQALLYRLNGDRHALHSDPAYARAAGFERPILHGLCTYGFTARALVREVCGGDPTRFGSMRGRFSSPVYPGQTLEVTIWRTPAGALFQTSAGGVVAIDHGTLTTA